MEKLLVLLNVAKSWREIKIILEIAINAIKNFIKKKLKEFIGRKEPPTDEEVEDIIDQAMEELKKKDLTKNFLHCRDKLNVRPNYKSGK